MSDPLGNFLSRAFWGVVGYRAGRSQERALDRLDRERERLRVEREEARAENVRLRKEAIDAIANRVYTRMLEMLADARVGGQGQDILLADIVGQAAVAKFAEFVADWTRRELRRS